jgi:hypothetical protein
MCLPHFCSRSNAGGGAKNLNYQSLAADLGRATLEIPFNIPSYFALVARALGILEGIALTGKASLIGYFKVYFIRLVLRRLTGSCSLVGLLKVPAALPWWRAPSASSRALLSQASLVLFDTLKCAASDWYSAALLLLDVH